jgi:predicted phage-related endonuclease
MKTVQLVQGTPEWHAHRAQHWNASDAPAAMGCSPHMTRTELLNRLHTGISPEVGPATQRRFDDGHRFEALARTLAEKIIGEELYPVTGVEGCYSASFDGLTMMEDVAFEHKALNAELLQTFNDIDTVAPEHRDEAAGRLLPMHYQVQMEHQAMVSGCVRILFMASKWAGDELVEERHCWYYPNAELRNKLRAAWAQLEQDLATYVPSTVTADKPTGKAPDTLPALRIEVTGMVTASNLAEFKETALAAIRGVNRELSTDQDFADAEQSVKWCEEVETRLKAAKEHALSQTASIDALFKTIDDISAEARKVRLELDKLVKARKEELRQQIVSKATQALSAHVGKLLQRIGLNSGINVAADFAGAVKGKRSLSSIQDAVDTVLAQAKIEANERADLMESNIKILKGEAHDWGFLFPDLAHVAGKSIEDFANLLAARIKAHQDAEAARRGREAAEAAAKAAQVVQQVAAPIAAAMSDALVTGTGIVRMTAETVKRIEPASARNDTTIKLGKINACLAPIQITQAGLSQLGFDPVGKEGAAVLYLESHFPAMCQAIAKHVMGAVALV